MRRHVHCVWRGPLEKQQLAHSLHAHLITNNVSTRIHLLRRRECVDDEVVVAAVAEHAGLGQAHGPVCVREVPRHGVSKDLQGTPFDRKWHAFRHPFHHLSIHGLSTFAYAATFAFV